MKQGYVTARWVIEVEVEWVERGVVVLARLVEDDEVVPVKMDGMCHGEALLGEETRKVLPSDDEEDIAVRVVSCERASGGLIFRYAGNQRDLPSIMA